MKINVCPTCKFAPFIGQYDFKNSKGPSYEIGCLNSACESPFLLDGFGFRDDAIEDWNVETNLKEKLE